MLDPVSGRLGRLEGNTGWLVPSLPCAHSSIASVERFLTRLLFCLHFEGDYMLKVFLKGNKVWCSISTVIKDYSASTSSQENLSILQVLT